LYIQENTVAYYPDLLPCSYFGSELADTLITIGWLDEAHPYAQGDVSEPFLDKLFDLLAQPWAPTYLLGYHDCPWCGDNYSARYTGRSINVGALNLFVPGAGFLYAAPSMIAHYILAHAYAPPTEFRDAVLQCPTMRSPEYFEAIIQHGPACFAQEIEPSRE
jgi:hypothetical protein